ncbi:MAG: hypothetical protein N3B01_04725 [Verrucomicrobiae bacterium]|nr:hypothetical protein [Verrucomicrobiae bacterium]
MSEQVSPTATRGVWSRLAWVAIYAVAMGLLEAVCVIYLRRLLPIEPTASLPALMKLKVEVPREVCTIVMLLAVAWLAGTNLRTRLACFFFAFGIWDILYYVGLRWWTGWPESLLTWDCLFLIPKPWYGPVLAPVLCSLYFIGGCCWLYWDETRGRAWRLSPTLVGSQLLAFAIWYWSFVKDSESIAAKGFKTASYSWWLWAVGTLIGLAGLWRACASRRL